MASHRENSQVHQESAPRAPVVPQHATGMRNNNGNEQRQIGLTSGAQFGVQARTAGTDPGGTSQPGQNLKLFCPGCGGKSGNDARCSLSGPGKQELRSFVEERRRNLLERIGICHQPNSSDTPLQQMSVCNTCRRDFYREKKMP